MPGPEELLQGGRYQLLAKLGEGSQGTTFEGIDKREGRPVAIKRFSVRGAASWKDVELAEREATVLASLSHPSLPAHVDHFEEDGALYLVMEKIEGQSLAALVKGGNPLGQADVVRFLADAAGVLAYLHGRSPPVVHRDINPKNVIRRPDGSFVLVDFGAVRDRLRPEGGSTVVGTFGYMAPEQFQGRAVPASDVYAVGATALRLLTGVEPEKLPHKGLAVDVAAALPRGVDPALRVALERMLEPDPDKRAASLTPIVERLTRDQERARRTAPRPTAGETRDDDVRAGRDRDAPRRDGRDRGEWRRPSQHEDWADWGAWGDRDDWRAWADGVSSRATRAARRHAAREERQAGQRAERRRRRGRPLYGPPLFVAVIGLNVAIVMVALIVGVFVPLLLTLLSIVLGAPLRDAARRTREAAASARESMKHAEQVLLHGAAVEAPSPPLRVSETEPSRPAPRARVRVDEADGRDVVDTTGAEIEEKREEI